MDFDFKTYTQSSEYLDKDRIENNKPVAGKLTKVSYFLLYNFGRAIIKSISYILIFLFISFLKAMTSGSRSRNKYTSSKYKKVVKEGFFWDSIEYHER